MLFHKIYRNMGVKSALDSFKISLRVKSRLDPHVFIMNSPAGGEYRQRWKIKKVCKTKLFQKATPL